MKWDLSAIFKDQRQLDDFVKNTQKISDEFNLNFKDKIVNLSPKNFINALKIYENLCSDLDKIMSYAELKFAIDTSLGVMYAKYQEICKKIQEKLIFFEVEFLQLNDDKINELIAQDKNYSYYLQNLKKHKPHTLSLQEERILLLTSSVGSQAFARLFDENMTSLRFKLNNKQYTQEEILSKLSDKNQNIRKKSALSLSKTLNENINTLTYIINMIRKDLSIECELRHFKHKEDMRHLSNHISETSVDSLIKASENSYDIVSSYYKLKKKILI